MCITTIQCPRCGNRDSKEIELRIERQILLYHSLGQDKEGIYAQAQVNDEQDVTYHTASDLYCRTCQHAFDNPGITLKWSFCKTTP